MLICPFVCLLCSELLFAVGSGFVGPGSWQGLRIIKAIIFMSRPRALFDPLRKLPLEGSSFATELATEAEDPLLSEVFR